MLRRVRLHQDDIEGLKSINIEVKPEGFLGGGAFGAVYTGKYIQDWTRQKVTSIVNGEPQKTEIQVPAGAEVAVKIISYMPKDQEDIKAEVKTHEEVVHPNITELIDLVRDDEPDEAGAMRAFLILEKAQEGDLNRFLAKYSGQSNQKMPEQLTKKITKEIIAGLEAIHNSGRFKGDVRAGNILVFKGEGQDEFTAKLADFGSTRKLNDGPELRNNQMEDIDDLYVVFVTIDECSDLEQGARDKLADVRKLMRNDLRPAEMTPKQVIETIKNHAWFTGGEQMSPTKRKEEAEEEEKKGKKKKKLFKKCKVQ